MSNHEDYRRIFTDGSKDGTKVAAAAVCEDNVMSSHLPDNSTIFSGAMHAINLALMFIRDCTDSKFIIFADSLSSLVAIENRHWDNPLTLEVLNRIHNLLSTGKIIMFVWLPSHVGIQGNTDADVAAKTAINAAPDNITVPHTDFW